MPENTNTPQLSTPAVPAFLPLLTWSAPTIRIHKRSPQWYSIGGIIILVGSVYGIITGAWSLSLVLLLIGGIYFLMRDAKAPPAKTINIMQEGVIFEDSFIRWEDFMGFWILQTPEFNELHLTWKDPRRSPIVIQTSSLEPLLIKKVIGQFLSEQKEETEGLLDTIARILKL